VDRPTSNPKRGRIKKHTECFSCSRIYFDRLLPSCPHCGSAMVRHYNSEELNCLSQSSSTHECFEFEERATVSAKAA
jgi:ribosomal protein L37E